MREILLPELTRLRILPQYCPIHTVDLELDKILLCAKAGPPFPLSSVGCVVGITHGDILVDGRTDAGWNSSTPPCRDCKHTGLRPAGQPLRLRSGQARGAVSHHISSLHQALIQHRVGYFEKAGNVRAV